MLNPLAIYSTLAALLLGLTAGWTARDWKADSDQLAAVERAHKAEVAAVTTVNKSASDFEQLLADLRPHEIETRNTIREVYRNVEVPAACAVPDAAVGLLDDARQRANAAASGEPVAAVRGDPGAAEAPAGPGQAPVGG